MPRRPRQRPTDDEWLPLGEAIEIVEHQARLLAGSGVPVGESLALFVAAAGLLDRLLLRVVDASGATPARSPVGAAGEYRTR